MENTTNKRQWQDWVNLILGVWLIISPWVMNYNDAYMAAGNSFIMGVAVVVVSLTALISPQVWEEWINLLLAAFLIISPLTVGFTHQTTAVWNVVVLGLLIGADAVWALSKQVKLSQSRA